MAKILGSKLPRSCLVLFSHDTKKRRNYVILLLTMDKVDEFSRICLLSPYQIMSTNSSVLYLQVYSASQTRRNLDWNGKSTLVIPEDIGLAYVQGKSTPLTHLNLSESGTTNHGQAIYRFQIIKVLRDRSAIAPIISQLKFDDSKIRTEYRRSFEAMRSIVLSLQRGKRNQESL